MIDLTNHYDAHIFLFVCMALAIPIVCGIIVPGFNQLAIIIHWLIALDRRVRNTH